MTPHRFPRRTLFGASLAGVLAARSTAAQTNIYGRIAFIQDGNIMQWTPEGVSLLHRDGNAMSPSWRPGASELIYVRNGGSFSNLITLETGTGRTRRLTDSESTYPEGSQDYVLDCDWINDACWSESDIIVFSSNAETTDGGLNLWVLRYTTDYMFPGPNDGAEPGQLEKVSVDADGRYAAYTVTGDNLMSSYISLRDLDTGTTFPVMEGAQGAYDAAISPNSDWVVGTIRDSDGVNDLWIWERETENTIRLTHGEQASNVTWDPYGDAIAYLAFTGSGFSLRAIYLDFSGDDPVVSGDPIVLIQNANIDSTSRPSWNTAE
ncbi:MAG: hypothetical protein KC435_14190 [Thermomicrobiales bacterium]|nr:hypothetical protein [Thermomicrobiales bacterium]